MKKQTKLNLGCGKRPIKGYINLDIVKLPGVNVIHNLNKFPYPFNKNTFEEIYCSHILEHVEDLIKVMEELSRIAKPNAKIKIISPYFASLSAFLDPTHKIFITGRTFNLFDPNNFNNFITKARFKILKRKLKFTRENWGINKIPEFIVNKTGFFNIYERFFCFVIPFQEIYFELRVIK